MGDRLRVLGLGAKGTKNQTALILHLRGEHGTGHFLIDNTQPFAVRAKLTPIMQVVGVPFARESPAEVPLLSASPVDVADQIRKFAALREDGLITDEEFAVQKERLLSE